MDPKAFLIMLNALRNPEGVSVQFICPNPDFNGGPNEVVIVCAEWTNWEEKRYGANTLFQALENALEDAPQEVWEDAQRKLHES